MTDRGGYFSACATPTDADFPCPAGSSCHCPPGIRRFLHIPAKRYAGFYNRRDCQRYPGRPVGDLEQRELAFPMTTLPHKLPPPRYPGPGIRGGVMALDLTTSPTWVRAAHAVRRTDRPRRRLGGRRYYPT